MNRRTLNLWVILIAGLAAFTWMVAELVRAVVEFDKGSGMLGMLSDGVVQHKVGELMVAVPFVAILALSNVWPIEKITLLVRRTTAIMIIGGLLNGLAWYSLREKVPATDFLRVWCLIIFAFGIIGPWLLIPIARSANKR